MNDMSPEEQETALLKHVPEDGSSIGNTSLMRALQWTPIAYWPVRNRLVERGLLDLGRAGRQRPKSSIWRQAGRCTGSRGSHGCVSEDYDKEATLYAPMAKVVGDSWVADAGFDNHILQITAQQGASITGGSGRVRTSLLRRFQRTRMCRGGTSTLSRLKSKPPTTSMSPASTRHSPIDAPPLAPTFWRTSP